MLGKPGKPAPHSPPRRSGQDAEYAARYRWLRIRPGTLAHISYDLDLDTGEVTNLKGVSVL